MTELNCCYIEEDGKGNCLQKAEWEIWYDHGPDDYTHSCDLHVWKLITDSPSHRIVSLEDGITFGLRRL